jgi:hypothetical protein
VLRKLRVCCLQNTASFNTSNLSWLVLDEADRLLDLGFEAKLKAIIEKFDSRSSNGADTDSPSASAHRRRTVLLSATLHPGLSVLAGLSLQNPVGVGFKAEVVDGQLQLAAEAGADGQEQQQGGKTAGAGGEIAFELPQQLKQKYVEVDAKMRLVYLIGGWVTAVAASGLSAQGSAYSQRTSCLAIPWGPACGSLLLAHWHTVLLQVILCLTTACPAATCNPVFLLCCAVCCADRCPAGSPAPQQGQQDGCILLQL